ncbi:NUDIX domain-containing protein [Streptomyces sp. NPDC048142]|uniref:NUDIX domain-containing protein n=1 Tax=Streptomyces sp. NPDC048142 TaxID=3365501 RepID=UPI00371D102B
MSSSLPPPARGASQSVLPAARYTTTRHAVWLGAAAIITDQAGRVLLVHPTYREDDRWLLPGGVVEPGEHPHTACRREITEELGLPELTLSGVLAVHSLSQHHPDIRPGTPCPGEIRYVFDGGPLAPDQAKAIRLPREELSEYAFLETRDAVQRLRPVDGQIMLAAYHARLGNTATAHLADGRHILDVPPAGSPWRPRPLPPDVGQPPQPRPRPGAAPRAAGLGRTGAGRWSRASQASRARGACGPVEVGEAAR